MKRASFKRLLLRSREGKFFHSQAPLALLQRHVSPRQASITNFADWHRSKRARADAERECADYGTLKGHPILCASCGGNSRKGERLFLPCDFCPLQWHLDCLDPPMANPPAGKDGRPPPPWKCPSHADTEFLNATRKAQEGASGQRVIKLRRPKNARVIDARAYAGLRNNGIIEIELEPSDDEGPPPIDANVVQRMTEEGVKLDFIRQVKYVHVFIIMQLLYHANCVFKEQE